MHINQQRLLELAKATDISVLGLREIGRKTNIDHPQTVKYHLEQLVERGFLERTSADNYRIPKQNTSKLVQIPILGNANCGEPLAIAQEELEGYVKLSPKLLTTQRYSDLFAVNAVGNSMNQALGLGPIENGDIVIADSNAEAHTGDYIVSTIDGAANIKRFYKQQEYIALKSESSETHPPIFIHPEDQDIFTINGVIQTIYKSSK